MKTVWIYSDGEVIKVFESQEAAEGWLAKNDPDGTVFEYRVEGSDPFGGPNGGEVH